jgi:hypothetical protein
MVQETKFIRRNQNIDSRTLDGWIAAFDYKKTFHIDDICSHQMMTLHNRLLSLVCWEEMGRRVKLLQTLNFKQQAQKWSADQTLFLHKNVKELNEN